MREILLTKGKKCIVDDTDFEELSKWKWMYGANGYAVRDQYDGMVGGKKTHHTVLMHRQLLNPGDEMDVDHINQNKLDNRRSNLREATRSQNRANVTARKRKQNELPMGITYNPSKRSKKPYMARVCRQGKSYFVGNFYELADAVEAYKKKKLELFGEFA